MFSSFVLAAVAATSPGLPVQLETCEISQPALAPQPGDIGGFDTVGQYQLHVRFTDIAAVPITKIVFRLGDGTSVVDVGKFSPGVMINHSLPLDATVATACAAQSILLADGTQLAAIGI